MRWIESLGEWIDRRLQLSGAIREAALHRVPRSSASWWYVFGSAALTVFILQVVTGILLAIVYVPSAAEAWNSLQTLNHDLTLGWFLRAMHGWGSNFMVALVLIHMVQVFLFGAHKYPRELTWIVGVFLLLMTLGMAFSWPGPAFRPGRLLGSGHRRLDHGPRSFHWGLARQSAAGWSDHRRRNALPFLRPACVCDPGDADRAGGSAPAHGAQARDQ